MLTMLWHLDGKELSRRNRCKPAAQNLLFHYLGTVLLHHHSGRDYTFKTKWCNDRHMWVEFGTGDQIQRSMLEIFAIELGVPESIVAALEFENKNKLGENEERLMAKRFSSAVADHELLELTRQDN